MFPHFGVLIVQKVHSLLMESIEDLIGWHLQYRLLLLFSSCCHNRLNTSDQFRCVFISGCHHNWSLLATVPTQYITDHQVSKKSFQMTASDVYVALQQSDGLQRSLQSHAVLYPSLFHRCPQIEADFLQTSQAVMITTERLEPCGGLFPTGHTETTQQDTTGHRNVFFSKYAHISFPLQFLFLFIFYSRSTLPPNEKSFSLPQLLFLFILQCRTIIALTFLSGCVIMSAGTCHCMFTAHSEKELGRRVKGTPYMP